MEWRWGLRDERRAEKKFTLVLGITWMVRGMLALLLSVQQNSAQERRVWAVCVPIGRQENSRWGGDGAGWHAEWLGRKV